MERYFIFNYAVSSEDGYFQDHGNLNFTAIDGCMPSWKRANEEIKKRHPQRKLKPALITNIIEMTRADYFSFLSISDQGENVEWSVATDAQSE